MDEQLFHEKVKALFPHAVAISTSCSIQTGSDGEDFATWSCGAYATPISTDESVKIAFGYGYSEEMALADIILDAERRESAQQVAA